MGSIQGTEPSVPIMALPASDPKLLGVAYRSAHEPKTNEQR
jgi:hypothetical protein